MVLRKYVGGSVRRKEDPRLITGSSTYVDDLTLPNMAHAIIVRSSYPHAEDQGHRRLGRTRDAWRDPCLDL